MPVVSLSGNNGLVTFHAPIRGNSRRRGVQDDEI